MSIPTTTGLHLPPGLGEQIAELAEELSGSSVSFRSYSGRGMSYCIAFGIESPSVLLPLGAAIAHVMDEADEDPQDPTAYLNLDRVRTRMISGCRTDTLGLGMIAYWPGIETAPSADT